MYYTLLAALALVNALAMQAFWPRILVQLGKSNSIWGDIAVLILFIACYLGPVATATLAGLLLSRHVAW